MAQLPDKGPQPRDSDTVPQAAAGARPGRKQVLLRLDPAVHEALARWASDELRSVNAQIEIILRRALVEAGRDPRPAPMRGRGRPRKSDADTNRP